MTYTITRENGVSDAMAVQEAINLCAANGAGESVLANLLRDLRDSIEEHVKPAITEPKEFGSIVRAVCLGGTDPQLWQRSYGDGKHYWESETGVVDVWSDLTDVEVLRVGLAESMDVAPECTEDYKAGVGDTVHKLHQRLQFMLSDAIGAERKNAIERMIQAVEELAP